MATCPHASCSTRAGGVGLKWRDASRPDAISRQRRGGRVKGSAEQPGATRNAPHERGREDTGLTLA